MASRASGTRLKGDESAEETKKVGAKMEDKRRVRVEPAGWERSMGGSRHVSSMEAGPVHPAQHPLNEE